MKCQKCDFDFEEHHIDSSHDIPKYIGGTDEDGRHNLCNHKTITDCHGEYDKLILIRCLKIVGEDLVDDSERVMWMKELKKQPEEMKKLFREEAKEVREVFFKKEENGDANTTKRIEIL